MQTNYEILELFPTPVYTTMLPNSLASVVNFFDKQEIANDSDSNNYGFRSKDSYLLDKPECKTLANYILTHVREYAEQLGYEYDSYRFAQSWISIKEPNQRHAMHTHPNGLLSGVFYYGLSEEETPAIAFHKTIVGVNCSVIQPKIASDKKTSKYAWPEFSVMFKPGLLLLFPSYLAHSVPVNKSNKARYSLAFNIVPEVGFGDEKILTELKF